MSTEIEDSARLGEPPLCRSGERDLGAVAVYPRTAWRPDQKEPELRAAMAARAIESVFGAFPCGQRAMVHPIDVPRDWHEADIRRISRGAGAQTLILIQIREFGPHFTSSPPVLWGDSTQIRLHFRAIALTSGQTILDIERLRTVGAPFAVKSAADLEGEMEVLLRGLIGA